MSIKELLFTGWIEKEFPYRQWRPIWQMLLLIPFAILYYPASWYVDWMDKR